MWCVPTISDEFVDRMEDVLRLYARKFDPLEPVVALYERPVVLSLLVRRRCRKQIELGLLHLWRWKLGAQGS